MSVNRSICKHPLLFRRNGSPVYTFSSLSHNLRTVFTELHRIWVLSLGTPYNCVNRVSFTAKLIIQFRPCHDSWEHMCPDWNIRINIIFHDHLTNFVFEIDKKIWKFEIFRIVARKMPWAQNWSVFASLYIGTLLYQEHGAILENFDFNIWGEIS